MATIVKFLLSAFAILITAYLLEDFGIYIHNYLTAILVALVLSLLNMVVKPIITILTLPVTILTLGLFLLIINAFIIYMAGWLVPGFDVANIWVALVFGLIYSLVMSMLNWVSGSRS